MTVVKLGGSIVTDKRVDFSYRDDVVRSLGRAISASQERIVLVHGGGSFGHPIARKYGLSSSSSRRSPEGVAETRKAMLELNARICDSLLASDVLPYTFSPYPLLTAAGREGLSWLRSALDAGLTPVTFGDVVLAEGGFTILSGDTISLQLSRSLGASRCVFVMDVEGILDESGKVMGSVGPAESRRLTRKSSPDATGGIGLKVREALRMAASGTEVAFVSGFRPRDFSKALKLLSFHGTLVRVPSRE